jgi:AcrR family transcriptional regulator
LAGSRKGTRGAATKARIVDAATRLFIEHGYLETTVAAIASEAGVALQTLYLSFGSKVAILRAAHDIAVVGDDAPIPVLDRPWVAEMRAEPDGRRALHLVIDNGLQIIERVMPIIGVIQAAAADADVGQLLRDIKGMQLTTQQAFARELATKKGFRPTLTPEKAGDIIHAVASHDMYRTLVIERGWPTAQVADFVYNTIAVTLFPSKAQSSSREEAWTSGSRKR